MSLLQGNATQNRAFDINQARVNKKGHVLAWRGKAIDIPESAPDSKWLE